MNLTTPRRVFYLSLIASVAAGGCGSSAGKNSGVNVTTRGSGGVTNAPSNGGAPGELGSTAGGGAGPFELLGGSGPSAGSSVGGQAAAGGGAAATGGNAPGAASGGDASGGQASGGSEPSSAGAGAANGELGAGGNPSAAISKTGETVLTSAGMTIISYGGYLNGESFQEDGIVSYNGYQYAAYWNSARHVALARRALPTGTWATIELTDYTNTEGDAHNTISLGVCPGDGTLHLSFDHHVSNLHYRKSVAGLLTNPATATWAAASFSAVSSQLVSGTPITQVTYPRFITEPGGGKVLFEARIGSSGSGDEYLWEYDGASHSWLSLGRFINGTGDSVNAYPHGLSYTPAGSRLHLAWCWRETPDAASNHDLLYVYSDDNGRTWKNNVGATVASTGASFVTKNSAGTVVWPIAQNRGLINQEHMAVDAAGRVHVLLSHLPDDAADDANFDSSRTKSQYFHYLRSTSGTWTRAALNAPAVASFRGKLGFAASGNLYAVLPDMRIAGASVASNFRDWSLLSTSDSGRFFSDPLIDTARLESEHILSVFYPQKGSADISVLDYTIH